MHPTGPPHASRTVEAALRGKPEPARRRDLGAGTRGTDCSHLPPLSCPSGRHTWPDTHEFAPDRGELEHGHCRAAGCGKRGRVGPRRSRLRLALDAPRAKFLAQFNLLSDGVQFLVDLRCDLLAMLTAESGLEVLKVELDGLLERWFDPGFLELKRITWQSPALVLEKLMAYEAVHPIASWNDLRNRLDTDRRCYAFFHPRLPDEPLIFVEIALAKGAPESVQALLDENAPVQDPRTADTAVFYSISNTQRGLRGISFGNLLLKRVIVDLQRDLPRLKVFATLSPLPVSANGWIRAGGEAGSPAGPTPQVRRAIGIPNRHRARRRARARGVARRCAPRRSAARTAAKALRALSTAGKIGYAAARYRRAISPDQRRTREPDYLARRYVGAGLAPVLRHDGELPLRPERSR